VLVLGSPETALPVSKRGLCARMLKRLLSIPSVTRRCGRPSRSGGYAIDLPKEAMDVIRGYVDTQLRTATPQDSDLLFPQ
jgi:hypothetical protein